jgi:CBS domain-containing protein
VGKVKELVEGKALVFVHLETSVFEAAYMMSRSGIGAVVVLDQGKLKGIFTERDILNRVMVPGRNPETTMISEVMTPKVVVADGNQPCEECLHLMQRVGCRHLPIVEGDRLIGMISMRDLLMHDNIEKDSEIKMMNYLYYYQPPVMEE